LHRFQQAVELTRLIVFVDLITLSSRAFEPVTQTIIEIEIIAVMPLSSENGK